MNGFYTTGLLDQPNAKDLEVEVLTHERLEAHFSSMDVATQNQIRMVSHMNNTSIHSVVELMILEGKKQLEDSGESISMPMFSLIQ